ncbi:uncharacterized protein [Amphiura filiformis]|uniref:uncharacterized protein n=1 Tax=Amphiura filiformis TaxID=82378 RepID=UPI003B22300F
MLRIVKEKVKFAALDEGCIVIVFLLPPDSARDLITAAMDNSSWLWLPEMKVFGVHVEGEEYISVQDVQKSDQSISERMQQEALKPVMEDILLRTSEDKEPNQDASTVKGTSTGAQDLNHNSEAAGSSGTHPEEPRSARYSQPDYYKGPTIPSSDYQPFPTQPLATTSSVSTSSPSPTMAPTDAATISSQQNVWRMCGSAQEEKDVPGLLTLDLSINKVNLTDTYSKQARCKVEILKRTLEISPKRPHRFALRHIIAVFVYRLGEENDAIQELEKLTEEDPCNLNVLRDLVTIFEKHGRKEDEADFLAKIAAIRDKDSSRLAHAQHIAGQGLAWSFDLHVETRSTNRLDKSIGLFTKALEIAGDSISDEEREDWLHHLARDYVRVNYLKRINKVEEYYKENLVKALECIEPNVRSGDLYRKSEALCLLGTLFSQRPAFANYLELVSFIQKDFKPYWYNPEKCFLASLEANQSNFIALNQLARRYYYSDRKESEALDCLNKSLQLNSGLPNHEAFRIRASIRRSQYNKQVRDKIEHEKHNPRVGKPNVNDPFVEHQNPDINFLGLAMDDLQKCIKYNPYDLDMINLAEVYRKLAWKGKHEYDRHLLYRALSYCSMAEKYQDKAMRSDLHQCRALILQDLNDLDSAIRCFMQAIDCENPGTKYNRNFILLFYGLLRRYQNSADKPKHLLQQLAYWLEEGMHKYAHTGIKISKFVTSYPEEMMSILEVLSGGERKKQVCLAEECLQAFKDTQSCDKAKLSSIEAKLILSTQRMAKYANQQAPTAQTHDKPKEDKAVIRVEHTFQSLDKGDPIHKETHSERGILTSTQLKSHQRNLISDEESIWKSISLDEQNLHERKETSTVEVANDICAVLSEPSPSESSPLARYLESLQTSKSEQPPRYERRLSDDSASSIADSGIASYEASQGTPESLSDYSDDEESYTFSDELPHSSHTSAFRRIVEEPDLRKDDIGDPPEKALHPDFKYDFYVVYNSRCEKTSDFVYYHLRSQLEEGTRPLKGCIQERDFLLGTSIIINMKRAIENSAKILLLISTGFFENEWCNQVTTLAFEPDVCHKLVPILLDHMPLPRTIESIQIHDAVKTINWGLIRRYLNHQEARMHRLNSTFF